MKFDLKNGICYLAQIFQGFDVLPQYFVEASLLMLYSSQKNHFGIYMVDLGLLLYVP